MRWNFGLGVLLALGFVPAIAVGEPLPAAVAGFSQYVARVETRLEHQYQAGAETVASLGGMRDRLRHGEVVVERLTPGKGDELPGALLHDWRGTAFVPGATAADFDRVMRRFEDYPRTFAPQVIAAHATGAGDHLQATMRVRQKHVITVVMETTYDVSFTRLDAQRGYSVSRSTRVTEIGSSEDHGFLWRMNTYWSYEERDGGLYVQVESVSLSRSIPAGLGWAVRPFVESVPRESVEFTLRAASAAMERR
jgi:hypothetical protein